LFIATYSQNAIYSGILRMAALLALQPNMNIRTRIHRSAGLAQLGEEVLHTSGGQLSEP
jgi:hypothetical protein